MLINKYNYKPNEIAVLFRNNSGSLKIEYALKKLNIPFTTYGKQKFFKYDKIKRLVAFYRFLENPDDYILYRQQAIPIDEAIYQYLIPEYKSSNKRFIDYLVESKYDQLKPLAIKIKELVSNKSKYDKSRLFDIILKLLFNDSYNVEKNYLIEFKDLLVNCRLALYM